MLVSAVEYFSSYSATNICLMICTGVGYSYIQHVHTSYHNFLLRMLRIIIKISIAFEHDCMT